MSFSDRVGLGRRSDFLQVRACDEELRKAVWNAFYGALAKNDDRNSYGATAWVTQYFFYNLFNRPIDEVPHYESERREVLKEFVMACEWNRVYDFIEVADKCFENTTFQAYFSKYMNSALQRECSGYRLVDGMVVEVTSEIDRESLSRAMSEHSPFKGPRDHIRRAAELLFDRNAPDPRNSIKESISAVEGMVRIIAEDPTATLGSALKRIESKHTIHPSLKEAFSKLYGFASDSEGVRHGMVEDSKVGSAEAKYMLLACSAFLNYLVEKKA